MPRQRYNRVASELFATPFDDVEDPPPRVKQHPDGGWFHVSPDGATYTPIAVGDYVVEVDGGRSEVVPSAQFAARFKAAPEKPRGTT